MHFGEVIQRMSAHNKPKVCHPLARNHSRRACPKHQVNTYLLISVIKVK